MAVFAYKIGVDAIFGIAGVVAICLGLIIAMLRTSRRSHPLYGERISYFRIGRVAYHRFAFIKPTEDGVVVHAGMGPSKFYLRFKDLREVTPEPESVLGGLAPRKFFWRTQSAIVEFDGEWGRIIAESLRKTEIRIA